MTGPRDRHALQLPTHRALVRNINQHDVGALLEDALIVIPTRDRPGRVEDCIENLSCDNQIVILGTTERDRDPQRSVWSRTEVEFFANDYESCSVLSLPTPHSDLAAKRNYGLRLARHRGIENVLFLDDDIVVMPDLVDAMLGALRQYHAVGAFIGGEADHSFLYSVLAGMGLVYPFISASCLAVKTSYMGTFPTVYNEDWFYLFPYLVYGRVGMVGQAKQLPWSPCGKLTASRVSLEELGDLLAEGLMNSLHQVHAKFSAMPSSSWSEEGIMSEVMSRFHSEAYWERRIKDREALYQHAIDIVRVRRAPFDAERGELLQHGYHVLRSFSPAKVATVAVMLSTACNYPTSRNTYEAHENSTSGPSCSS